LTILLSLIVIGSMYSMSLPYMFKTNIVAGDLSLPEFYDGTEYGLSKLLIFVMICSVLSLALKKKQIVTLIMSLIVLMLTFLIRYSIHFHLIDHDYDSNTGVGFLLLFTLAILHLLISSIALFLESYMRNPSVSKK